MVIGSDVVLHRAAVSLTVPLPTLEILLEKVWRVGCNAINLNHRSA